MTERAPNELNDLFLARSWRLLPLRGADRTVVWDGNSEFLALVENSVIAKIDSKSASQAQTLKDLLRSLRG